MWKIAFAAGALVVASATGQAAGVETPSQLYHRANLAAPWGGALALDQREVIAPPGGIDPDMAIPPPATGARMPIVRPVMPDAKPGIVR